MIENLDIEVNESGTSIIRVPSGIRFISDWKDYNLDDFDFPHILNKKIPGCGYTEYCITNNMNVILCSPRKMLLENKTEQHPGSVFYYKNEYEEDNNSDKDLSSINRGSVEIETTKQIPSEYFLKLNDSLGKYVNYCYNKNIPCKILVTYDSYRHVKEFLTKWNLFDFFYTVIDEHQVLFVDSKFKSTTELEFINQLKGVKKVCYVSATPMISDYLKELDEFKDLPYFELDWYYFDHNRVVKPNIKPRITKSIVSTGRSIIQSYKNKKFEVFSYKDASGEVKEIVSTEAVIYVNSVKNICDIISKESLSPSEVNILCSKTDKNISRIHKRLGNQFNIGKVPLENEPNKMFTFCTRTVYLGADFYSNCARTFILSDANIDCLAVDIILDLPQILGRQRSNGNPWKNCADLYYKTILKDNKQTKKEFDEYVKAKLKKTYDLIDSYNRSQEGAKHTLAETYKIVADVCNYRDNYVAVNKHAGNTLVPVLNKLVLIAEKRAFDIQQIDYKDRFSVFNTIQESDSVKVDNTDSIKKFFSNFDKLENFYDKMKYLCESPEVNDFNREVILDQLPLTYRQYYEVLGNDRCKSLGYNITKLKKELSDIKLDENVLRNLITVDFKVGEKYTKEFIKQKLQEIYNKIGYNKTAKAIDLESYFYLKDAKITNQVTNKRENGFEIVREK